MMCKASSGSGSAAGGLLDYLGFVRIDSVCSLHASIRQQEVLKHFTSREAFHHYLVANWASDRQ